MTFALLALVLSAPLDASAGRTKTTSTRVVECKSSDSGETRSASFLARMRAVRGTDSMRIRFTLLERFGDERLHPVKLPELRAWRESKRGVREFRFKQTVTALQGGGEYRMRVDYRWLDSEGDVIRRSRSVTPACNQPGDLPNLQIGTLTAQPGTGGTTVYIVPVQNNGQIASGDFAVELFVDGAAPNVAHVESLEPGEIGEARFNGPACQRSIRAVADPGDAVKERFESDNAFKGPCPPVGG